jgi:hypothetical protein
MQSIGTLCVGNFDELSVVPFSRRLVTIYSLTVHFCWLVEFELST